MLWIYGLVLLLDLVWTHSVGLKPGLSPVFMAHREAQQILVRRRRANQFLEEMKAGNLERECIEEICDYEEAQEIFDTVELTNNFWAKYVDGDACESSPCTNQGNCRDTASGFICDCKTGFRGRRCQTVILLLCDDQNGGCDHFCDAMHGLVQCSCADGYFLSSDNQSCLSTEPFKCGAVITSHSDHTRAVLHDRNQTLNQTLNQTHDWDHSNLSGPSGADPTHSLIPSRLLHGYECPAGECPWQALLIDENRKGFCGGTILSDLIILTSAHCVNQSRHMSVILGEFDTEVQDGNEAVHVVESVVVHQMFKPGTFYNDIALIKLTTPIRFNRYMLPACLPTKDFAEKFLMQEPHGLVSGFGLLGKSLRPSSVLQRLVVPYVERVRCIESTAARISSRMFCGGYEKRLRAIDRCQGDLGGPHVTRYRDTYFITGITAWSQGCEGSGTFTIYTQVSKYIRWIQAAMQALKETEQQNSTTAGFGSGSGSTKNQTEPEQGTIRVHFL